MISSVPNTSAGGTCLRLRHIPGVCVGDYHLTNTKICKKTRKSVSSLCLSLSLSQSLPLPLHSIRYLMGLSSTTAGTLHLHYDENQASDKSIVLYLAIYYYDPESHKLRQTSYSFRVRIILKVFRSGCVCSCKGPGGSALVRKFHLYIFSFFSHMSA